MSISYVEKIEQEIKQMPTEYLPALFNIVHIFRESVSVKTTFLNDLENESLSDNDNQLLKSAIADGLKGQIKDATEVFSRLENKYKALENGFSL